MIMRMSRSELWQFVKDGENARVGASASAPTTGSTSLQGATLVAPLLPGGRNEAETYSASLVKPPTNGGGLWSFLYQCLTCWDMGGNFRTGLCKKDGGVPEMRILNGLRVLSIAKM